MLRTLPPCWASTRGSGARRGSDEVRRLPAGAHFQIRLCEYGQERWASWHRVEPCDKQQGVSRTSVLKQSTSQLRAPQQEGEPLSCPLCPSPAGLISHMGLAGLCSAKLGYFQGGRGAGCCHPGPWSHLGTPSLPPVCLQGTPICHAFLCKPCPTTQGLPKCRGEWHVIAGADLLEGLCANLLALRCGLCSLRKLPGHQAVEETDLMRKLLFLLGIAICR